ncbi:MAG TPA: glycosyltransferase family 2 protein [Candidatus Binatia bacterium]|jgi:glycosyltransferase involved in cell wall biosynthesis
MSVQSLKVAVVVPAYRAAETIQRVLAGIPAWVDAIYVVEDASPDDTAEKTAAARDRRVRLLRHRQNRGVGGAMTTGYKQALLDGVDICVKMDADGQMDPEYLPHLIEPLVAGRADYAKGNRFHDAAALRRMPLARRVGNAGLSFLIKAASGQWNIFDPTNGYTAIHRSALEGLEIARLHPRYFFESSMLIRLREIGALVEDVPMPALYNGETSHLSAVRALVEFPALLLREGLKRVLWQYFVADFNAVSLFLVCGIPLALFGFFFGAYHWIVNSRAGTFASTGTVMLAVLPLILGFQLLLQALVLDVQSTPRRPLQLRRAPEVLS